MLSACASHRAGDDGTPWPSVPEAQPKEKILDLSFAKNASAGIALRCRAFVTVMQAAEVGNPDDRSDTRDLSNMRTLLVES
jgi:hypothetical protein